MILDILNHFIINNLNAMQLLEEIMVQLVDIKKGTHHYFIEGNEPKINIVTLEKNEGGK